ncbi:hypothetical protein SCA6_013418 [Theobroma cacao]
MGNSLKGCFKANCSFMVLSLLKGYNEVTFQQQVVTKLNWTWEMLLRVFNILPSCILEFMCQVFHPRILILSVP